MTAAGGATPVRTDAALMRASDPSASPDDPSLVEVGEAFSDTHRFTPEEVSTFSSMMGDTNPLHHDAAFAQRSRYGALIVSGTHTGALLMGLTASHFSKRTTVVGVGFDLAFKRPVFADATVTLEWTVAAVKPHRGGVGRLVELVGAVRDAEGRVCVAATGTVLVGMPA